MKTNASSTASAWGIKWCIYHCEVNTKTAYGGSNLQLSMYKLQKKVKQLFFLSCGNEIHTCVTVKEHIEDKIFKNKKIEIISHNIYNNRGTALSASKIYTFLKSNRSMFSFGKKHWKYDMHIYFHASFLGIAFKSFIDNKDYTAQSVCKNN